MNTLLIIINIVLILLLILNLINIFSFKKILHLNKSSNTNLVSVLIPARNEESNIENCINSVLNQTYSSLEIIILDDNSTDNTLDIINSFNSEKIKIIKGENLPEDWVGKNFACHQLSLKASGEFLLFIDADTILKPGCISDAIDFAILNNSGLLSVMPFEKTVTFWEKAVIPMLYFALMVFMPVPLIERSGRKEIAVGNGQFMLFSRKCYDEIGGHESLKNRIVEDVWLAKRVKEFGQKLIFADGSEIISCRMYRNSGEVWKGFSKNFFAGLSFSLTGLIAITGIYFLLFIFPLILLLYGFFINDKEIIIFSITAFLLPVIIRITQALRFRLPFWFSFLNFLSSGFLIAVAVNSFRIIKYGRGANWKGRDYKESVIK